LGLASTPASGLDTLTINGNTTVSGGALRVNTFTDYGLGLLSLTGGSVALHSGAANTLINATVSGVTGTGGGVISTDIRTQDSDQANLIINVAGSNSYTTDASLSNGGNVTTSRLSVTKNGTGTQTLAGASTYSGGTTVNLGTLILQNNTALGNGTVTVNGGTLKVSSGNSIGNAVTLSGGTYSKDFASGNAYSLFGNPVSHFTADSKPDTAAAFLAGTAGAARNDVALSFATAPGSAASNDASRISDVFSLNGTTNDTFVLQLSVAGVTATDILGYLSGGQWVNAVQGNDGGTANFVGNVAYNSGYFSLGNYGVDTTNGSAWAVINHNSDFAIVTVPEPGVASLLGIAAAFLLIKRRKA